MAKYKIKIDRKSIRKNPKAGATSSLLAGEATFTVTRVVATMDGPLHQVLKAKGMEIKSPGIILTDVTVVRERRLETGRGKDYLNYTARDQLIQVEGDRPCEHVEHEPLPDWLYEHRETKVRCRSCKVAFPHTELESDSSPNGEYSYAVCPKCGIWDCCKLQFEKISTAIAERKRRSVAARKRKVKK